MRLMINTENVRFTAQRNMEPKLDNGGKQKFDRMSNLPMWTVQVNALDHRGGEIINVTVVSEVKPPRMTFGTRPSRPGWPGECHRPT
jgi:hypothetical protein